MKRSRHQIISEILKICISGANKTRIVYQANLNFRTVNPYLLDLVKKHLIDLDQGEYITTSDGLSLLENINQVNEQLYGHGHEKTDPMNC